MERNPNDKLGGSNAGSTGGFGSTGGAGSTGGGTGNFGATGGAGTSGLGADLGTSGSSGGFAGGLQATADWVRDANLDDMRSSVERQVKEHPGRTLLIAVGLGYLLGKALRK